MLQAALRCSNEAFAENLGIGVRTVAFWHQKPARRPRPEIQQLLDTALEQAPQTVRARFDSLMRSSTPAEIGLSADAAPDGAAKSADAEGRLNADPDIRAALAQLDQHV